MFKILIFVVFLGSCKSNEKRLNASVEEKQNISANDTLRHNRFGDPIVPVKMTDEEWKSKLTKEEYYVMREKGTERAFTGDLVDNHKDGLYTCAACGLVLFKSNTKFESGTGWPSFYQPEDPASILESTDYDLGYERTEVMCYRCGGHLGHVFPDGPKPTGLRYCINSVSLNFVESKQ